MAIQSDDRRYSSGCSKRTHQRSGPAFGQRQPDRTGKVCYQWQAGRCTHHNCRFLHSEPPAVLQDPSSSNNRLVWRNPKTGGIGGSGARPNGGYHSNSKWGKDRRVLAENTGLLNENAGVGTSQSAQRPCKHFMSGSRCPYGDRCRCLHSWSTGDGFSLLTTLKEHQKAVTAIALPSGSDKLYTASMDSTVKVWDCHTGQCAATVSMGHEVGSMISKGPWLFVGTPDSIKVWNTQTGAEMNLPGPTGQVYALVVANDMLFAGAQDGSILVWKFSAATNCFKPANSLLGHHSAVISLAVGGMKLYSGSMDNTIKAWDLSTLECIQTLSQHTHAVMSLLRCEQFLFSGSLDSTVKIWVTNHNEELEEITYKHREDHGVISIFGVHDGDGTPVLMCALNDGTVHLYDLPSFNERGKIYTIQEVRSLGAGPGGLFFTGDGTGEVRVWKWSN